MFKIIIEGYNKKIEEKYLWAQDLQEKVCWASDLADNRV